MGIETELIKRHEDGSEEVVLTSGYPFRELTQRLAETLGKEVKLFMSGRNGFVDEPTGATFLCRPVLALDDDEGFFIRAFENWVDFKADFNAQTTSALALIARWLRSLKEGSLAPKGVEQAILTLNEASLKEELQDIYEMVVSDANALMTEAVA